MSHEWLNAFWAEYIQIPAPWPLVLGISLALLVLGELLYRGAFGMLHRWSQRTQTQLDNLLLRRARVPARVLPLAVAIHTFLVLRGLDTHVVRTTVVIVELLLVSYLVIEIIETFLLHYWLGERRGIHVPAVVRHLLLVIVYTVAVLSIVGSVTGINVIPVLATSTVVTVVLGLALQDTLGNLFSGLALHTDKPFQLGDWILVDGQEGQVVYMGWRSVHLRTFSWDVVAVPNSVIAKARLQNFYAPNKVCARNIEFLVRLGASPEQVERAVRQACDGLAEVRKDPAPKLWLVGMTPLFQRYVVKVWIDDFARHDDIESDVLKALFQRCHAEGVALREGAAMAGFVPTENQVLPALVPSGGGARGEGGPGGSASGP